MVRLRSIIQFVGVIAQLLPARTRPVTSYASGQASFREHRKPVMWVHVHKNGGSTMCIWARLKAKEKCVTPWANCNSLTLGDDWLEHALAKNRSWTTCAARTAFFRQNRFTWGQIERELSEGDVCMDDFIYGIMLRDPIKRIESYANSHGIPDSTSWIKCVMQADASKCPQKRGVRIMGRGWENYDNFLVRTLGGYDVMSLPPGGVNATHYEAALMLLKRFDIVSVLEQLDTKESKAAMDRVLGWHPEGPPKAAKFHTVVFPERATEDLRRINKFDYDLYNYFARRNNTHSQMSTAEGLRTPKTSFLVKHSIVRSRQ